MIDGARAFCGVTQLQIVDDALLATGLDIRGRISKNQFIIGSGSIAEIASTPEFWMENDPEWGVRLGYMYKTLIGPVSASIHYSSLTEHVNGLLNIGFTF
jgi:NTE family protein